MGRGENAGCYVITSSGQQGRTKNRDKTVKGKVIVYVNDEHFRPVLDEKGEQKKLLCHPDSITILGFIN